MTWTASGATVWSAGYAALGLWWCAGRGTFPFGVGPANGPAASLLHGLSAQVGAPLVATVGFAGIVVGIHCARRARREVVTTPGRIFAWMLAAVLLLVVPDGRALAVAAYAPLFLVGVPFDWPPGSFWQQVTWPEWNQYLCVIGGALWGATALADSRRAGGRCVRCGRHPLSSEGRTRAVALRRGRKAVAVAMLAPLPYAATRLAWAFGIPIGMPADVLTAIRESGSPFPAGGLAAVAIGGALLTSGLVRPWGEVIPAWVPWLGGRRVPPAVAVIPATAVAVLVFGAGRGVVHDWIKARLRGEPGSTMDLLGLLWPIWGVALATAAFAYHIRRRGHCRGCGRG